MHPAMPNWTGSFSALMRRLFLCNCPQPALAIRILRITLEIVRTYKSAYQTRTTKSQANFTDWQFANPIESVAPEAIRPAAAAAGET